MCRLSSMTLTAVLLTMVACNHEAPFPEPEGERIVIIVEDPPKNLDPRFATQAAAMRVSRLVFDSLVSVDNPRMEPEPLLAERWSIDPADPRRWTITLRQGVTWHDGEPFDAQDVAYTFNSVMDPAVGSPFRAPYGRHLERVEALNSNTVLFVLKAPYATFLTDLVLGIVPEHVCSAHGDRFPEGRYIGTGPYTFGARYGERRLDLVAREGAETGVKHLIFRTIKDEGTRLMALLGGSADLMQNGISPVLTSVLEDDPRLKVTYGPSIAFSYVALNLRHPKLADRRVRQALAYAIPRQRIVDTHLGGHATLATGMLAPMNWAYEPKVHRYDYDPAKARALLKDAGLGAGGERLSITIKISTHRLRRTVARTIAQAWREIGVDADVRAYEFGTFYSDIKKGHFQAYLLDVPEPMEPDMYSWLLHGLATPKKTPSEGPSAYAVADRRYLSPGALDAHVRDDPVCRQWRWKAVKDATGNWISRAFGESPPYYTANRMFYANPLVDCRVDLGQETVGRDDRRPLYQRIQQLVADDLPVIPLWHPDVRVVSRRRIAGFVPLPNLRLAGLVRAYIED